MNWQLAANHRVASEVITVDNMAEFRRLSDREIEHFIELWRQEECLWKITNKNYLDINSLILLQRINHRYTNRIAVFRLVLFTVVV